MFSIIQGNIFQYQAEAIALPSDLNLQSSPGLRQSAYTYFGLQNIQQPINNYLQQQKVGSIQYSQAITLPVNHKVFKSIIHCIVPKYKEKQKKESYSLLSELFENIFNEIYQNKIQSILIPTIGCGNAEFALDESLMHFGEAFQKFREKIIDVQIKFVVYSVQEYEFAIDFFQYLLNPDILEQKNQQISQGQQNVKSNPQNQQQKMKFEEFDDDDITDYTMNQNNLKLNNKNRIVQNQKSNQKIAMELEEQQYSKNKFQQSQEDNQYQNQLPLKNYHKRDYFNQIEPQNNIPSNNKQNIQTSNQPIQLNNHVNQFQDQQPLLKSFSQKQENKILLSLYIDLSNIALETIQNQKDLLNFMLQVCIDINKLHCKLLLQKEKIVEFNNNMYKLHYKLSANLKELSPFCPPEMQECQYVSDTQDSFAFGILCKSILDTKFKNEKDQQISQIKSFLEKQISETTSDRSQINVIFNYLQTFIQTDENMEENFQITKKLNKFYQENSTLLTIQELKKQMMETANKNQIDLKLKQHSFLDPTINERKDEFYEINRQQIDAYKICKEMPENLMQNINQEQVNQFQDLNLKLNNKDQSQFKFTQCQQNRFQQDCQFTQKELKLTKIDCVAIPVDKNQFKQSLPPIIKLESLDNVLEDIINLAKNDQEHFLQAVKTNEPVLGCNQVLLVFCPNQNNKVGRQIQLANCFRDILLYSLKCLKLYTCFLCLDDIYNNLIVDQTDLPTDTPIKAFHEAINKYPDPLSQNVIKFNNKNWIVVRKDPLKFRQKGLSVSIYKQDISEIKGVDAIVNAANSQLIKGGGVCGSIFRAAGEKQLEQEINSIFSKLKQKLIDISDVVVTKSYNLEQEQGPKFIFHAVGPIYNSLQPQKSEEQLSKCIFNILLKCQEYKISSIAIPSISSGIFGFPILKCAEIFYSTILSFQFQTPLSIHIVDVIDRVVEIFQSTFKGQKQREIIHQKLEQAPETDCLVGPIDLKIYNSGVVKKIIELAGPSFKNELEYKIKNYQMKDDIEYGQSFLIQGYKLKFNNIYQVLLISTPQNLTENKSCLLYQVFLKILIETFLKKKFSSITILIYGILQQCLTNEEDLKTYDGTKAINIFLQVIQDFQQKYNQECGKITILSNVAQFCTECELIFK